MIYVKKLLKEYRKTKPEKSAVVLNFQGVGDKDVYNITAPFFINDTEVIAGRVESREDEHSNIRLFKKVQEDQWEVIKEGIDLELQDPFYTIIDGKIILGGVEVFFEEDDNVKWRTVLYELKEVDEAIRLFEGPLGMKDLRLKQLKDGRVLVLTRPQGDKGGRGKIGYTVINRLDDLSVEIINNAPLLTNQFNDEEWGGGNEIHVVEDDIYVLGHIANFDNEGDRHYYAILFLLDLENGQMKDPKIIAERSDFLEGPAKRPDLVDVVFSGGLLFEEKTATLYAGISDAGAQKLRIVNPLIER
ncbi:DUF1861 family protein [Virgibacillus pantothenticus]|uniref:DUF1861 family protein n=1 Tax=Virgibacillus pantothenticus TaxID=1473 RepID=UPI000987C74D|nr:DUF1861 family protein [Virgibacillus pantothenticus]